MIKKTLHLDLYFDESGNFNSHNPQDDYGYNQIAGVFVLAANRAQIEEEAKALLRQSYQQACTQEKMPAVLHGTNLRLPDKEYHQFIQNILKGINQKQWQPIRLVNQEKICYGHPQDNYLNMIAELLLKIYQQKQKEGFEALILNVYPAYRDQISEYYLRKIHNTIGIFRVREDLKEFNLTIKQVVPISANNYKIIQLCDLLSNASYKDYQKCDEATKNKLVAALGDYNYTLIVPLFSDRCERLIQEGSYALALRLIILELQNQKNQNKALEYCQEVLDNLAKLPASECNAQLSYLVSWLEQTINQERLLQKGVNLGDQLLDYVNKGLKERLKDNYDSIIWFEYAVHFWQLSAYNHLGNLSKARAEVEILTGLKNELMQQIEYITLFMESLVAIAVHYTDCFEYASVDQELDFIETFYELTIAKCVNLLLGSKLKSQLRAKALGTWLQAKVYQYLQTDEASLLEEARSTSDRAIEEFVGIEDKKRQYQYRCQLETVEKNFSLGRQYLAKSLSIDPESTHEDIAKKIMQLDKMPQGFALLHWSRLGCSSYENDSSEWTDFKKALSESQLLINNPWCQGSEDLIEYPIHGILRQKVSFCLKMKNYNEAKQALKKLSNLNPVNQRFVLGLVQLAAYTEYIVFLDEDISMCDELLEKLEEKSEKFPQLNQLIKVWKQQLKAKNKDNLLEIARKIGY